MNYFEISAKSGENITNMFNNLALLLIPQETPMINSN